MLGTRRPRRRREGGRARRNEGLRRRRRRASPRRSRSRASTRSRRSWPSPARRTFSSRPRCSRPTSPRDSRRASTPVSTGTSPTSAWTAASSSARARRSATRCSSRWAGRRRRASASSARGRSTRSSPAARRRCRTCRPTFQDFSTQARLVDHLQEESSGPSIEDADVIVAGGRGLGGPEGFSIVRGARSGARRRGRRDARRRGRRLVPVLGPGRADRQDRLAEALHRARHLRRDPAQGRDAGLGHDRRDQQGPERADLRLRRPRRRRRPARRSPRSSPSSCGRANSPMKGVRPADYPPPFSDAEAIGPPTDAPDERIDVGILIVGGGPGGLACAIRLGQLLEEHPDAAGAARRGPRRGAREGQAAGLAPALRRGDEPARDPQAVRGPARHRGHADVRRGARTRPSTCCTKGSALRIPPPPTMRNHGNWIVSVSELGRFLAEQAEAGGAMILPETAGAEAARRPRPRRRRSHGRQGARQGRRAARRTSSRASTSPRGSPCSPRARRAT